MRGRRLRRAALCALLGVVLVYTLTWAVLGVMSATTRWRAPRAFAMGEGFDFVNEPEWPFGVPADWPEPVGGSRGGGAFRSWVSTYTVSIERSGSSDGLVGVASPTRIATRQMWGWPCRCLETRWRDTRAVGAGRGAPATVSFDRGIEWPGTITLPLRPLWPGFAVNAAFYAGVCWILLAVPGVLVRWRRRRRGRCPACGYELAGLDRCSECGSTP